MTTQLLQFVRLPDHDRQRIGPMAGLGEGEVELHLRTNDGVETAVRLPREATDLVKVLLDHLLRGERVAVLAEDQELSPNDAASLLGISRPLVVHRMNVGDLPFRYVGKHRRAKLGDVLTLKARIDGQRTALAALAEDTEDLMRDHAL